MKMVSTKAPSDFYFFIVHKRETFPPNILGPDSLRISGCCFTQQMTLIKISADRNLQNERTSGWGFLSTLPQGRRKHWKASSVLSNFGDAVGVQGAERSFLDPLGGQSPDVFVRDSPPLYSSVIGNFRIPAVQRRPLV